MFDMDTSELPPEVAEQAAMVKRFMAGLEGGATGVEAAAGTTAIINADQAEQTNHAQESAANQAPHSDLAAEMQQQPGEQQQASGSPQAQVDETAEQRYRVLQGIHRADVARLGQQVKDLQAELEALRSGQRGADGAVNTATSQGDISGSDNNNLEDMLEDARLEGDRDEVRRIQSLIRERERKEILREFEPIRQQVSANADDRYIADLNSLASGWEKHRNNPAFVEFLQQPAPFTGVPLLNILNDADAARDVTRVSEIYNAFSRQQTAHDTAGQGAAVTPRTLPASLVAPARTTGGATITPQPKVVTREQLEAAASDVGKGLITAEAYNAMQQQYLQQSVFKQ